MMQLRFALVFVLNILVDQSHAQTANCICTPFFRCYDMDTGADLDGLVDDRLSSIGGRPVLTLRQNGESTNCLDEIDVCCHSLTPGSGTTPKPKPEVRPSIVKNSECGVRNLNGIDFEIKNFKEGQAQYGEFPWMVAVLNMSDSSNHFFIGGGSLIHPQVVLSAAHLPYDNMANDSLIVRLGEWNFQKNNEPTPHQDIKVKQVIYHPRFDRGQMENNYVLLILEHRAVLGETVRTICLPPSNAGEIFNDQLCYLTGWGKSVFSDQAKYQRIMKLLRMRIVEHSKCETALKNTHLGNNFTLHKSNICAGDQGIDACTGDGGSPLVCRDPTSTGNYVQVGVTSYGIGCGTHGLPGVYAAVAPAIDWINENLDKLPDQEKIATSSRLPDSTSEILSGPTTKKPLAVDPRISFNN